LKSDLDQTAEACVQVKGRKNQTMGQKEAYLVPFLPPSAMVSTQISGVGENGCVPLDNLIFT